MRPLARLTFGLLTASLFLPAGAFTRNIMVTGYWPNTNEMIRHFSTNPEQNPGGWQGDNWENRGYDVHAFFPEFPEGTFPVGVGDFTVDYQDTSADFWRIVDQVKPIAIITFSRGFNTPSWEIERKQRNLENWVADYVYPFYPTPSPPDGNFPSNGVRESTLPMEAIAAAVNAAGLGITAYIDHNGYGGGFLSEYMAYHGVWYQSLNAAQGSPYWCVSAGHIHVGGPVTIQQGKAATEISLRQLIAYVDTFANKIRRWREIKA